ILRLQSLRRVGEIDRAHARGFLPLQSVARDAAEATGAGAEQHSSDLKTVVTFAAADIDLQRLLRPAGVDQQRHQVTRGLPSDPRHAYAEVRADSAFFAPQQFLQPLRRELPTG